MNLLGEAVNATCKVLGHGATFNSFDTNPLQSLGESVNYHRCYEETCFI